MARTVAKGTPSKPAEASSRHRKKVTYSLPEAVAREVDRRCAGSERGKSRLVAEALAFYFAAQDRRALALLYAEAAQDPQFKADNDAVRTDFAALDHEADRKLR